MRTNAKTPAKGFQKARKQSKQLIPAQLTDSLVISTGEARKILGADAQGRTDDEIAQEILDMTDLAQKLLINSFLPIKTV